MNEIARESMLFDCYGELLTERKHRVMELYHEENLSLSEIAEEFGVSRSAVYDSLRSARKQLEDYESKLGMLNRTTRIEANLREIDQKIGTMIDGIDAENSSMSGSDGIGLPDREWNASDIRAQLASIRQLVRCTVDEI